MFCFKRKEVAMDTYPLTVLYEETCPLCKLEIDNLRARDAKGLLRFVDVSAPDFDPLPYGVPLTYMAAGATPDNERNYEVEDGGKRSRNFLAVRPRL
jgi:DCC1-like thiol-disulfide oxidoreductase